MYRLKDIREDRNIKQTTIGDLLGLKQNSYSQIENGVNNLQVDQLIILAKYYNTSTDYLLRLTDEEKPYPRAK